MPWLDFGDCSCNCTKWPRACSVLVDEETVGPIGKLRESNDSAETTGDNEEDSDESDDFTPDPDALDHNNYIRQHNINTATASVNEPLVSEKYRLKGSSYHSSMQKALRNAQRMIAAGEEVQIAIFEHTVNVRDENALIAKVTIAGVHKPIGYIPGRKIKKFKAAMDNGEITSLRIDSVFRKYIEQIDQFMLFAYIIATKRGRWGSDQKSYKYNS